ncbi:3-oxoacyl-acyl-carrier- synthase [Pyrenophora seminiperda CCB06]|uniref:3-oxoacyl-acyl-carrier-synthase n=1 Tax=Pyrenophora seminiperda CCB06 TaxID=1302712 RepID=A0A3M7M6J1_9PLEO|nr:3-oxoacyl-acyl-carrier- synthase [Pyrenophora seminiperda CCB06]
MASSYKTVIPTFRGIASSAISFLTAAKEEQSKNDKLPSGEEMLNSQMGDMLPFRMQPIILAKFQLGPMMNSKPSATSPSLDPAALKSFDDVINFFKQLLAVIDAVDEKAWNENAQNGLDVEIGPKTLHMTAIDDFAHSFVIPNSYFHLNAMYMLLRMKGFALGKITYVGPFMSEQMRKDWAPLRS